MKEKFYSVWSVEYNRWTIFRLYCPGHIHHGESQRALNPYLLTKEQAEDWCRYANSILFATLGSDFIEVVVKQVRPITPEKVIPDFPLDKTIPILQAGHIQDRQRKRYKYPKQLP